MGQTLSEPVVEKFSHSGADERLTFGLSSMQGWRISMEDSHAAVLDLQNSDEPQRPTTVEERLSFFGVYDGHGGDKVAVFSGENIHKILAKQAAFAAKEYEQALKDAFLATDRAILQDSRYEDEVSGCTASAALITSTKIYVANAGDSRTVLGVKGRAKPLSFDHKPQNEGEKARITAAGGFVDFGRVNGNLALSRAIGDFEFKKSAKLPPEEQVVTAYPDVMAHEITDDDEFLVVACDGIWDCQSSQAVIEFVRRGIVAKQELDRICENLMDSCLSINSETGGVGCDNMTVVIVGLLGGKTKEQWYDMIAKRVADGDGPCAPPEYAEPRGPCNRRALLGDSPDEFGGKDENVGPLHATLHAGRIIVLGDGSEGEKDVKALATAPNKTDDDDVEMKDAIATKPTEDDSEKTASTKEAETKKGGSA